MSLLNKLKVHVEDCAWNKNLSFIFYRFLHILDRRLVLPKVVFKNEFLCLSSERHLEKHMVPKNHGCFIDAGANIGFWTIFLAKKGYKVYSFEPAPQTFYILQRNVRTYSNVHLHPYALGEQDNMAKLNIHDGSGHNSLIHQGNDFLGKQVLVQVRTLDSFNIKNVGLIKIDTEGYEFPILLGASQTILRDKPRLIIEIHMPYQEQKQKITQFLKEMNYRWIVQYKSHNARYSKVSINTKRGQPHIIGDPY